MTAMGFMPDAPEPPMQMRVDNYCNACGRYMGWTTPGVIPNRYCWGCIEQIASITKNRATVDNQSEQGDTQ